MRFRLLAGLSLVLCTLPALSSAQAVHGTVVDASDRPVAGVVVQLLDEASAVRNRGLSNEQGAYHLMAPAGGTYRIRTLRIGFRASVTEPFGIPAGSDVLRSIALSNIGVSLDTMRAMARNSCRLATDSSAATFAVWEQVRTALTAAEITGREKIAGTAYSFERTTDADNGKLLKQRASVSASFINQPWLSLSPLALHKGGYVTYDSTNATTYYAPGIEVLLSPVFMEDHCFHLRAADSRIGVEFVPSPERQRSAEVRGILWLDRATSELRSLEYSYVNISPEQEARARGDMHFVRMRDGTWAIAHWSITMPVVEAKVVNGRMQRTAVGAKPELKVYELIIRGGELVMAQRGADTIWAQAPRVLTGSVTDSTSGRAIASARVALYGTPFEVVTDTAGRFRVEGLLPGNYTVEVRTASLDSVNAIHQTSLSFVSDTALTLRVPGGRQVAASLCGTAKREFPGIVVGTVTLKDDVARPRGMSVGVEWTSGNPLAGATERAFRAFETRTDDNGSFRFCGVPVDAELTFRTLSDTGSAPPITLRIPGGSRFARTTLEHDFSARGGAALVGMVVADSSQQPISGAQIVLSELSRATVSSDNGQFRLNDVATGTYTLQVRRVGYGPLESKVTFYPNQTVDRRVVLNRQVVLETVAVTETRLPAEFEESRRLGMGSFATPQDMEKKRGLTLESVLSEFREMHLQRTNGGHTYLVGARPPHSGCTNEPCLRQERLYYVPDLAEKMRGLTTSCYVQVYLDMILLNPARPTEPYDISTVPTDEILAVEYYPSRLQTPLKYQKSIGCGVLQLWSRRYQ